MNLTPLCRIVSNIPLKTRRRTSSEWLRRYSILHLCRYQYQHLPGVQEKAGHILLVHVTWDLGLSHRFHWGRFEVLPPQARAPLAGVHTLSPGRMDHIRSRTASCPLFQTPPGQPEPQASTMGAHHDHRRCVPDDYSDLASSLAGIQSL